MQNGVFGQFVYCVVLFGAYFLGGGVTLLYLLCAGPRRRNQTLLHGWKPWLFGGETGLQGAKM